VVECKFCEDLWPFAYSFVSFNQI